MQPPEGPESDPKARMSGLVGGGQIVRCCRYLFDSNYTNNTNSLDNAI